VALSRQISDAPTDDEIAKVLDTEPLCANEFWTCGGGKIGRVKANGLVSANQMAVFREFFPSFDLRL
jgi:hypothetical protein